MSRTHGSPLSRGLPALSLALLLTALLGLALAVAAIVSLRRPEFRNSGIPESTASGAKMRTPDDPGAPPSRPAAPSVPAPAAGADLTHAELLNLLADRGLALKGFAVPPEGSAGPAMYFADDRLTDLQAEILASGSDPGPHWPVLFVQLRTSAREAREQSGALPGSWSWGRFLFAGDKRLLGRVREALR